MVASPVVVTKEIESPIEVEALQASSRSLAFIEEVSVTTSPFATALVSPVGVLGPSWVTWEAARIS